MTPTLKRSLSILFSACLLAACSSNNKNNSNASSSGSSGTPASSSVTITGEAAKGIIVGGVVTAHPITTNAIDFSTILGTDITDSSGAYSIDISDYAGGPVAVRIKPANDGSTTMKCDLSAGCGEGIAFGGSLGLTDDSFSLDAVVPNISRAAVSVNISVLTNTAASVAVQALSSAASTDDINQLISNANSSVANRFGIIGDLTSLDIIDITNPVDVASADTDTIEYNLYSAAIVGAVLAENSTISIETAMTAFANQYTSNGGVSDTEETGSSTVTLAEILSQSTSVISAIVAIETDLTIDLGSLSTEITASTSAAQNGSTEPNNGSLPENSGNTSELLMAKGMIQDLRNIGTGLNISSAETFTDQVDLARETFDADAGAVFEAMSMAAGAIAYAWEAYNEDSTLERYTHEDTEIVVGISKTDTELTFNVDDTITISESVRDASGATTTKETDVSVNLSGIDNNSSFNLEESETVNGVNTETLEWTLDATANFDISGSATSDTVSLSISEGLFTGALNGSRTETHDDSSTTVAGGDRYDESFVLSNLVFDLEITLSEIAADDPITFTGGINIGLSALTTDMEEADTNTYDNNGYWNGWSTWDETLTAGALNLGISGKFSSASGKMMTASLAIQVDGNDIAYNCVGEEGINQEDQWTYDETCTEESTEAYADANFALIFSVDVSGVTNDMSAKLMGTRSSLENSTVNLELSYDGIMFDLEYDTASISDTSETFTITNHEGVIVTLTETTSINANQWEETALSGSIVVNNTVYATITEENGFVEIEYIDGSNVSL